MRLQKKKKKGNLILYRYPNRPLDVPLDNSDLIEEYIKFEEEGLTGAISMLLNIYPEFRDILKEKEYSPKEK